MAGRSGEAAGPRGVSPRRNPMASEMLPIEWKVIDMKRIPGVEVTTAVLFLLFATTAPVCAQNNKHEQEAKPAQQQHEQQQAKPAQQQQQQHAAQQQQQARPAQQQQHVAQQQPQQRGYSAPVQQRTQQQARVWQQQRGWLGQGSWQEHSSWQQDRAQNWQAQHRTWAQRGGYGGYYIPQDSFQLYFGSGHWFRIHGRPMIVGGYPRFQYGGFWFMLLDPWPERWSDNWYDTDDVYIAYDNGYYLYNRRDPGVGIAISVVL